MVVKDVNLKTSGNPAIVVDPSVEPKASIVDKAPPLVAPDTMKAVLTEGHPVSSRRDVGQSSVAVRAKMDGGVPVRKRRGVRQKKLPVDNPSSLTRLEFGSFNDAGADIHDDITAYKAAMS